MEATNFTREELAQYILHTAKDNMIAKFKAMIDKENTEEIVAYTTKGEPLTKEKYSARLDTISKDMDNGGKTYTTEEAREYIFNRKARLG